MTIYVESSAVLSWLMNEADGEAVRQILQRDAKFCTSILTTLEVQRALIRGKKIGRLRETDTRALSGMYLKLSSGWFFLTMTEEIMGRAAKEFPVEPIRSLDAIHLASALEYATVDLNLEVLTLDNEITRNLIPLGLASIF